MVLSCKIKSSCIRQVTYYLSSLVQGHSLGSILQYIKLPNVLSQAYATTLFLQPSLQDVAQVPLDEAFPDSYCPETDASSALFSALLPDFSHATRYYAYCLLSFFPN